MEQVTEIEEQQRERERTHHGRKCTLLSLANHRVNNKTISNRTNYVSFLLHSLRKKKKDLTL